MKAYGFSVLLEFDRIIGKDRIEIVLRVVRELEFFLVLIF